MNGNEFALSSFNGSWAFYFTGTISGDSIQGKYYSGVSFSTDWIASKNEQAKLREHEELTYVINDAAFNFKELEELNGKPFSFPGKKYKDKVVIFQIMGTWCPNCIDEINYFKTLYAQYNKQGLEIVAMAYEVGDNRKAQLKKLKAFKKRTGIPYKVVLAGTSKTEVAASHFPMLNGVMSFPTTIFVDKKGKIQKIFTGFSGPATGNAYKEIKDEIQYEVEILLDLLK
jgi:thiol-disulfide isomerase/thioredoxin